MCVHSSLSKGSHCLLSNFVQCSIFFSCNMLVFIPYFVKKNLAVLHVYFFLIIPRWNIFSMPYHSLSLSLSLSYPPTVSLFHLKSRPYPFQTSYFLKGKTLSSTPYLTKLMSVSYQLPFFHPRLSLCITIPSLLFTFFKNKGNFPRIFSC